MKKKILSLALTICMIMSLMPVISASGEGEQAYQLVYDFKNVEEFTNNAVMNASNVRYDTTKGTWAFHSWYSLDNDTVTYKSNYGIEIKSNEVGDYFAVKINVPYEDDYIATLEYYDLKTGDSDDDAVGDFAKGDVYILPESSDVSTAAEGDKKFIAQDLLFGHTNGTNSVLEDKNEDAVRLSAGENILVFYVTGCNGTAASGAKRVRPSKLTLTSGTLAEGDSYATVPMYINEAKANDAELEVGDSTTLTVSGWFNDGTTFDETSVTFSSESENINIDGSTVTASAAGAATVIATVTSGGKSISKDISLTVTSPVYSPAYQLVYDFKNIDGFENGNTLTQDIGFAQTEGTWAFDSSSGDDVVYRSNYGIEIKSDAAGDYYAVKINVPYAGDYTASLRYLELATSSDDLYAKADVYILPEGSSVSTAADTDKKIVAKDLYFNKSDGINTGSSKYDELAEYTPNSSIRLLAGENILVFYLTECGTGTYDYRRMRPGVLTLTSGALAEGDSYATVPMYINEAKADNAELETGDSTALTVSGWLNNGTAFDETSVTFSSESENINIDGSTVTASAAGTATVTATVTSGEKSLSKDISITVNPTAQEMVNAAFTVLEEEAKYTEPTVAGFTYDGATVTANKNEDGNYDITAPETKNGEKFLYWAKGLTTQKRIISFSHKLENYVPDESGTNYLIAVYEDKLPTTAEYYNANGQLLPGATENDRPYMAGYGTASGWNRYGNTNIYVAEYNNKTQPDAVTVMVENGIGGETVPYGEKVTCTADATYGTFRWWQKDVNGVSEIVSVDKEYSFLAYENCTVTAVYGDSEVTVTNPAKIIIDTFGENSIMAEFIGFGSNVVEKGIMWNNNRIAMTAPGNQFTVTADKNGTFKGYAIVEDGDSYTLITDGEATINNLAE